MTMIAARPREDFEAALRSDEPENALRSSVKGLLAQGWNREDLVRVLDDFRATMRQTGRTQSEEVVKDVLDALVGWTSPHLVIGGQR
jgi:hypothetical protein